MAKVTGSLQKSTEIMKLSNALVKLPQISQVMREMSLEMTKVRPSCVFGEIFSVTILNEGGYHGGDARRYPRYGRRRGRLDG